MRIKFDKNGTVDASKIYLATPDKRLVTALDGIQEETCALKLNANNASTLSFTVSKYFNGVETNSYEQLSWLMRIYVENIGWFIMQEPTIENDGLKECKTISAESEETVFMQTDWKGLKINCGTTDSREMLIEENVELVGGIEFAKEQIKFYNDDNQKLSLLHILIEDNKDWTIGYVDQIPKNYTYIENGETKTKAVRLQDEIGTFSIENTSKYAFMTQDIQQFFKCVLWFDFDKLTISAYRVENIGEDTNINIGFRNLQNSNNISVSEDSIYTKYVVAGGDNLGITYVNFGSDSIENIDYYLNTKYLPETLIVKYKEWQAFREEKRYEYIDLTRKYNKQMEVISELKNKLPMLDCGTKWSAYTDEELLVNKSGYEAQIKGYESFYVDEDGNFSIDKLKASPDYDTYRQIKETILPNIEIEIDNRKLPTSIGELDYLTSYETDWSLYGLDELQVKILGYQDKITMYKKNHYDISFEDYEKETEKDSEKYPAHSKDVHDKNHSDYLDAEYQLDEKYTDSCQKAFNDCAYKVEQANDLLDEHFTNRLQIVSDVSKENWEMEGIEPFTIKELVMLKALIYETDYVNSNIFTTSYDTTDEIIDTQMTLLQNAQDDLVATSQPQYTYSTTLDNFLSLPEYQDWSNELNLFDFVWLGVRDTNVVKLRVSSISYNPLIMDNNLDIEFTNMIRSGSSRNDFISLLGLSSGGSKNSITGYSIGTISGDSVNVTNGLIQAIISSSMFQDKVDSLVSTGGGGSGTINADYIYVKELEAEMIKVTDLYAKNGYFEYLTAGFIAADRIVAESASFDKLDAYVGNIDNLLSGTISSDLGHIINLTADNVKIDEAVIKKLIASKILVSDLKAGVIDTNQMLIESEDGGLNIVGNTMQFNDKDGNTRIQIGRDENDDFTFILYDETGTGVLIDSDGIKESAIEDGLIKTDMVADKAIVASNIDFESFGTTLDKDGNFVTDISQITIDGKKFETVYTSFTEETTTKIDTSIKTIEYEYYSSDSSIKVTGGSWLPTVPDRVEGKYIWRRDILTYQNGKVIIKNEICLQGLDGMDGASLDLSEIKSSISEVSTKVDAVDKSIKDKVWRTDTVTVIDAGGDTVSKNLIDAVIETTTDLNGISNKVSNINSYVGYNEGEVITQSLTQQIAESKQTFEGFKQTVESTYISNDDLDGKVEEATESIWDQTSDKIELEVRSLDLSSKLSIETGGISISGDRFTVDSTNFKLTRDGSLTCTNGTFTGKVTATTGTIGGWNVDGSSIAYEDKSVGMGCNMPGSNIVFWAGATSPSYISLSPFTVYKDGTLKATKGTIGGFTLSSFTLKGTNVGMACTSAYGWAFWAGVAPSGDSYPFRVGHDGALYATKANITGAITATSGSFSGTIKSTSGSIGGWTIGSTKLSNSDNTVGIATTATSFWAGATPGESVADTAKFRVANDGSMRAIKGNIGNMTLTDTYMYTGNMECGIGGNSWGMWSGGSGSAGSANFRVERATGDVYGNFANFKQFLINGNPIVKQTTNYILFYNGTKIVHFDVDVRPSANAVCCTPVALPPLWQFCEKPSVYTTAITQYPETKVKGATPRDRTSIGFNLYLYRTDGDLTTVSCLCIGKEW